MLKIDSWPPEPGTVHLSASTITTLTRMALISDNRSLPEATRVANFDGIGQIGANIADFLTVNVPAVDQRFRILDELKEEVPAKPFALHEFGGIAQMCLSIEAQHERERGLLPIGTSHRDDSLDRYHADADLKGVPQVNRHVFPGRNMTMITDSETKGGSNV